MRRGSEQALVELALAPLKGRDDVAVLVAVDGALEPLLAAPGVVRIDAVGAEAGDPRVHAHPQPLGLFLKGVRLGAEPGPEGGWLALVLDEQTAEPLDKLEQALRPGGVIVLRRPTRDQELLQALHARFQNVAEVAVPVELDGQSSLDYVYRARRSAPPPDPNRPSN